MAFASRVMMALPASVLLIGLAVAASSRGAVRNDIRQFRIGMPAAALPASGYKDFACAADPARKLADWADYQDCPADSAGRREVSFRYDNSASSLALVNEGYRGTRVGGHPVLISLLIGADARVDAIRIDTDPNASFYMRKKAFLFADEAKKRYGETGWTCQEGSPSEHEQPVGRLFIKRHCEKTANGRHLILDQELYRDPDKSLKDFVGGTRLLIERAS